MIRDFNVEWLECVEYIPAQLFQTFVTGAGIAAGDPVFQEIGSTGISGLQVAAASDAMSTIWHMGNHVDITKQIRFRVLSSKNSTDADVETQTVTYTPLVAGTTVLIAPATALSTAIPALTYGVVANVPTFTDFGKINKGTLPDTTFALALSVASTMTNASTTEISLLGLEIRYSRRLTAGPRRNLLGGKRLVVSRPLGVQLLSPGQEGL